METCIAKLSGFVCSDPVLDHETHNVKYYKFFVECKRLSGASDILPVICSEKHINNVRKGLFVHVTGDIRTHNYKEGDKVRLLIYLFAKDVNVFNVTENDEIKFENTVYLEGYVCKKPNYRVTPLGRHITDLLIAVNRGFGKSSYIPTIVWGKNAEKVKDVNVGQKVSIFGRFQSRNYVKTEDNKEVVKTAYEISAMTYTIL